jgi:hypothetical protein
MPDGRKLLSAVLCLGVLLAVLLTGCGSPSLSEYKKDINAIYYDTSEQVSAIFEDPSLAEYSDNEEAITILKSALDEAIEVLEMNYEILQGIQVPAQARELHNDLLIFFIDSIESFEGLSQSSETLDPNNQAERSDFLEDVDELLELGMEGNEIVDRIQKL